MNTSTTRPVLISLNVEITDVGSVATTVDVNVEGTRVGTLTYRFEKKGHRKAASTFAAKLQEMQLEGLDAEDFLLAFDNISVMSSGVHKYGSGISFAVTVIEAARASKAALAAG